MAEFTGGAPAVVSQIYTYIQSQASLRANEVTSAANAVQAVLGGAPKTPSAPNLGDLAVDPPSAYSLPGHYSFDKFQFTGEYAREAHAVAAQLMTDYDKFLTTWFGDRDTYIAPAVEWVKNAISKTPGEAGSGINPFIEDQLWARDRARLLAESQRAADEAMNAWVGRGFSMPPGMLVHQLTVMDRDVQDRIGESSRAQAIKSFETEIENVRIAVAQAFTLQERAIAGASKYMLDYLSPLQQGIQVARAQGEVTTALLNSFVSYYAQELAFAQQMYVRDKGEADLQAQVNQNTYTGEIALLQARAQAAASALQAFSTQAAAALNGLHAQASISGVDTTNISV